MEQDLSREFLKVVEEAAIAAVRTMGIGERKFSDQKAMSPYLVHVHLKNSRDVMADEKSFVLDPQSGGEC